MRTSQTSQSLRYDADDRFVCDGVSHIAFMGVE